MTALSFPTSNVTTSDTISAWPWKTGLVLFALFAMATWSWNSSQRWYASDSADVGALVDRISEGTLNRQAAFALLGVFGLGLLMLPSVRPLPIKLVIAYPIILFVGWAYLSIFWSVDHAQTLKRLIVFSAMVVTVLAVLRRYDIREIAQIALIAAGLTMAVGLVNEARILITDRPPLGLWRFGGTMHPNHAGLNSVIVMLASLYLFRSTRTRWFLLIFIIAFAVLILTKSRTALMSGVTATAAFWLLSATASRAMGIGLAIAWLVAGVMWFSSMELLPDLSGAVSMGREDVSTTDVKKLTGRTDIWHFAIVQGARDPNRMWTGYGFETFWTPQNALGVSQYVKFKISEGHNAYLDWFLELGIVGAGLYGLILLTGIVRWTAASRVLQSPAAALAAATLLGALIHGFAESSIGDANLPTFFVYSALAGAALLRPDEEFSA